MYTQYILKFGKEGKRLANELDRRRLRSAEVVASVAMCMCAYSPRENTLETSRIHQKITPPKTEVKYKTSSPRPCFPLYELTRRILPWLLLLLMHLLLLLLLLLSFNCGW